MRSSRFSRCLAAALFSVTASIPVSAYAQDEAQNIQPAVSLNRFNPAPAGDRLFGVPSPFVSGHLSWQAMLLFNYAHNPLVLRRVTNRDTGDTETIGSIVGNQMFAHVDASLQLWDRLGVNIDLPFAIFQNGESPKVDGSEFISPDSFQISDLRLGLRARLLGSGTDAFQLGIGGYIWFPTGNSDPGSFVGDGWVRGLPQVMVGGYLDRLVYSAALGPEFRPETRIANATQGTMFHGSAGAGYMLGETRALQVGAELTFATVLTDASPRNTNFEVMVDAKYRVHRLIEVGLGIAPGLTHGIGTPDLRVVAMAAYVPTAGCKDTDGDEVCDSQDACISEAGIKTDDPKTNGCPAAKDTDGDKIFDKEDACVDVPGVKSDDKKKNGCPPDKDEDGIIDKDDACVDVPGEKNDDPKKNGCPPDKDDDGIYDKDDACVDIPGVKDEDPKKNGCPPDKDNDGVFDKDDACPDIPGIKTDDPKTNGCPGDTDGDGIRDDKDACPNEKGKPDPDPKKNGCPVAVRVTDTEIVILQQVQFDTNKATIKPVSNPLLDEVAQVFKEHSEILKVEVQGHTDNKGSAKLNEKLSQNRAESVMKALIKRGIEESRLIPKGYGPNKPIDTNDTDKGRQNNRRVQFVIMEKKPKAPAAPR